MSKEFQKKLVVVGDAVCGKTCLLKMFTMGKFPTADIPTICDAYFKDVDVDCKQIKLTLVDTSGSEEYDTLRRALSYPDTEVILVCFSVANPASLANVSAKWVPEVEHVCPDVPFVLVGCKTDLRNDTYTIEKLAKTGMTPVRHEKGRAMANRVGAAWYLECSALTGENVREVFEAATRVSFTRRKKNRNSCRLL